MVVVGDAKGKLSSLIIKPLPFYCLYLEFIYYLTSKTLHRSVDVLQWGNIIVDFSQYTSAVSVSMPILVESVSNLVKF